MEHSNNFFTEEQIDASKAIELPLSELKNRLNTWVSYKGLVNIDGQNDQYIDGFLIVTEVGNKRISEKQGFCSGNIVFKNFQQITALKVSKWCNKHDLDGLEFKLVNPLIVDVLYYSYEEIKNICHISGMPEPKCSNKISRTIFQYDVEKYNKKSLFSLEEVAFIAANRPYVIFNRSIDDELLVQPYLEMLSDCIKRQHSSNYRLFTKELFIQLNDEHGNLYPSKFNDASYLQPSDILCFHKTLISKEELINWCHAMKIEIGLSHTEIILNKSYEALEDKVKELEYYIDQQSISFSKTKQVLKEEVKKLTEINSLLATTKKNTIDNQEEISFPIKTRRLEIALEAQKKFWVETYQAGKGTKPLQKVIKLFLEDKLIEAGLSKRSADDLSVIIKPENVN